MADAVMTGKKGDLPQIQLQLHSPGKSVFAGARLALPGSSHQAQL